MTYAKRRTYVKAEVKKLPRVIRSWSPFQVDIFRDINQGEGNTQVIARAGSGKTTVLVEGFYHIPDGKTALMVAFNKSIQTELEKRAPASVETMTLHSLGYRAIRKAFPNCGAPDNDKLQGFAKAVFGEEQETYEARQNLIKTVELCKGSLSESKEEIDDTMDRFGIDVDGSRETFIRLVQETMAASRKQVNRIDFTDMIDFPNHYQLELPKFDRVFIDESQDLNKAQINLALGSIRPDGRVLSCGDPKQSIYQFRGADSGAIDNIIDRLQAKTLPLSITYRCDKAIVELAQTIVPDLEAAPGAAEGKVESITESKMLELARPGSFILSRVNAPLIKWCLALLKAGVPANVQGRDLGKSLIAMIKKSKASDVDAFLVWLQEWEEMEVQRLVTAKRDYSVISDKADCLRTLSEGVRSLADLKNNIDHLFHDGDDHNRIILSSTHKAKGMERDTVFLLNKTYKPGKSEEESNLYYVGITRARHSLYLVS